MRDLPWCVDADKLDTSLMEYGSFSFPKSLKGLGNSALNDKLRIVSWTSVLLHLGQTHEIPLDKILNYLSTSNLRGSTSMWGRRAISQREAKKTNTKEASIPRPEEVVELTEDQKLELREAFSMFEKTGGKGRIPARDLGELLRCLGWNPSEQDLEEARHELELTTRGTISFPEVEAYIARRGGIYNGANAEEDIMVAFQV
ncbi:hypothetical protein EGW08_017303 [Elysia chlorotica]|uniref:EF-hand domain-containing protein n=1 Tax=Elysia chlorotica TaxID=188477 RepID=A0A433T074_ELYCH|nr:hypothetical protein EGW08_017303 [Elysia chlorotica]